MLRNIHFFNLKPGVDEAQTLAVINGDLAEYARSLGCIERKTWKMLDAHPGNAPALYMNEALWPSQKAADGFGSAFGEDQSALAMRIRKALANMDILQTVRYVDDED